MGALLSSFSEEGIDEYMCSPDESWPMVVLDDSKVPKTFRIKDVSPMLDSEGSTSGRVAKELIRHACESRGIEADITVPSSTCVNVALNEILESFHEDSIQCLRVPKDEKKIMQCICSGYPVSAVIPVTDEILEKVVTLPAKESDTFAMLPVVLWGYSSVSKKFAGVVPLSVYDEPVAISFSQVMSDDSCDFYVINVREYDDGSQNEDSAEDVALFCD
jgi:hypothetical protein